MTRIFLIALGFVLAGMCAAVSAAFAILVDDDTVATWALGAVYAVAVGVVIARLVFCWGGCGA